MADIRLRKPAVANAGFICTYNTSNLIKCFIRISALSFFALLTACQEKVPNEQDVPAAIQNEIAKPLPSDAPITTVAAPAKPASALSKMCGDNKVLVVCDSDAGLQDSMVDCTKTSLQIENKDGNLINVGHPNELAAYTAVGFGCSVSQNDKAQYVVVEYGELPSGCNYCEWFYIYDMSGKQLTKSDPIILSDESLPVGNKQYANNEHYGSLSKSLRLGDADIDYVNCDAKFNPSGSSSCLMESTNAK